MLTTMARRSDATLPRAGQLLRGGHR